MNFILVLLVIVFVCYLWLKYYIYGYWKRHKIPHELPTILWGNLTLSFFSAKISLGTVFKESYEKFKQHPFHGFYVFGKPILIINDPDLIKSILVKDFWKFCNRGWFGEKSIDFLTDILFLQPVERWKRARQKFTPAFTPGKLRQIQPLMKEISDEMIKIIDSEIKISNNINFKNILNRYTTDIISSVIYGFNCNSLNDANSEFYRFGVKALQFGRFNMLIAAFLPEILEKISLPFFGKELRDFYFNTFKNVVDNRQKEKIKRKDFMNLLIQLIEKGQLHDEDNTSLKTDLEIDSDKISISEAASQAFNLFSAGTETSSSTATYCLIELSMNLDIQKRLQKEIDAVAASPEGFTFDNIMNIEYLDMVFLETLRKHAPISFLNRICMEDYQIPNSNFIIPKGMRILISPPGLHYNSEYYPDPAKFDPTRFSKENVNNRNPYVYLPFSEGPRNCIGQRFGTIQVKQAVVSLLHNFEFKICDKTKLPIKYTTESFVQLPIDDVFLRVKRR